MWMKNLMAIYLVKKKKRENTDDSKLIFPLLLERYIYFVYLVWMFYLYVYIVYTPYAWLVPVEVRRALIIWNWSYKWLQATMWVQKLNSSPLQESISVSSFLSFPFAFMVTKKWRVIQALKKVWAKTIGTNIKTQEYFSCFIISKISISGLLLITIVAKLSKLILRIIFECFKN